MTRSTLKNLPSDFFDPFLESPVDIERSRVLKEEIIRRIKANGPMNFAEFMHESLYGHLGFYSTRKGGIEQGTPFLAETTSPEQDQLFARVIAARVADAWQEMGKPPRFDIVEMGAGTGALANDILQTLRARNADVYEHIRYTIVDLSPSLIEVQRSKIQDAHIRWIYGTAVDLPLKNIEGVILSNELVDSLLFHRVVMEKGHLKEIFVDVQDGKLIDVLSKPSKEFRDYFKAINLKPEEGVEIHVCLDAIRWMTGVAKTLKRGYVLTIDYGDKAELVHRKDGPWHDSAVAGTSYSLAGSQEKAIYERVGGVDITTYVDFTALMKAGERSGLIGLLVSQMEFLSKSGANASVTANLRIGELRTTRNLEQISQLFNERHKVLIQAKG